MYGGKRPPWLPPASTFRLLYPRFYTIWQGAVKRAGLDRAAADNTPLRPHDLRSVFHDRADRAGLSRAKIGLGGLGHSNLAQTDRYGTNDIRLNFADMERIAAGG